MQLYFSIFSFGWFCIIPRKDFEILVFCYKSKPYSEGLANGGKRTSKYQNKPQFYLPTQLYYPLVYFFISFSYAYHPVFFPQEILGLSFHGINFAICKISFFFLTHEKNLLLPLYCTKVLRIERQLIIFHKILPKERTLTLVIYDHTTKGKIEEIMPVSNIYGQRERRRLLHSTLF